MNVEGLVIYMAFTDDYSRKYVPGDVHLRVIVYNDQPDNILMAVANRMCGVFQEKGSRRVAYKGCWPDYCVIENMLSDDSLLDSVDTIHTIWDNATDSPDNFIMEVHALRADDE